MIVQAFTDIRETPLPVTTGNIYGMNDLTNTAQIAMGFGSKVFRGDEQGIWLGAKTFATAPFSVSMEGAVVATSLTLSGYLTNAGTDQSFTGSINAGASNVKIDGANKRILINDGTNDRVLIGYDSGGF